VAFIVFSVMFSPHALFRSSIASSAFLARRQGAVQALTRNSNFTSSSSSSALAHTLPFSFAGTQDDRKERNKRLYINAVPCLVVSPFILQRCCFSTIKEDAFVHSQGASREGSNRRERLRKRATDMRNKASSMRDSGQQHYRKFRENPRESAVHGAKSFGTMLKQYGPVFIGTYVGVYFGTLGLLFAGVEAGLMDPVQLFGWLGDGAAESKTTVDLVVQFMQEHAFTRRYAPFVEKNPEVANLAVAWVAVKFTEPVRLAVALGITPRIARYFGFTPRPVVDVIPEEDVVDAASSSSAAEASKDGKNGRASTMKKNEPRDPKS